MKFPTYGKHVPKHQPVSVVLSSFKSKLKMFFAHCLWYNTLLMSFHDRYYMPCKLWSRMKTACFPYKSLDGIIAIFKTHFRIFPWTLLNLRILNIFASQEIRCLFIICDVKSWNTTVAWDKMVEYAFMGRWATPSKACSHPKDLGKNGHQCDEDLRNRGTVGLTATQFMSWNFGITKKNPHP